MLEVNSPIGNIFYNNENNIELQKNTEKLKLSRLELEKKIIRKKTDQGTDIGLKLDSGIKLQNGDIFDIGDRKLIIEQLPEKVIVITLKEKNTNILVLLGHIIGNRHRPISIQNEEILFPIQADSEKEVFTKLFQSIINYIEISITEKIFSPHVGANVHEHG